MPEERVHQTKPNLLMNVKDDKIMYQPKSNYFQAALKNSQINVDLASKKEIKRLKNFVKKNGNSRGK